VRYRTLFKKNRAMDFYAPENLPPILRDKQRPHFSGYSLLFISGAHYLRNVVDDLRSQSSSLQLRYITILLEHVSHWFEIDQVTPAPGSSHSRRRKLDKTRAHMSDLLDHVYRERNRRKTPSQRDRDVARARIVKEAARCWFAEMVDRLENLQEQMRALQALPRFSASEWAQTFQSVR